MFITDYFTLISVFVWRVLYLYKSSATADIGDRG